MTWRFLIDANLPIALARSLTALGFQALHVADIDQMSASDRDIWRLASERGEVVVSKDADFAELALLADDRQPVVWLRMGNTRRQALLDRMTAEMPRIIEALDNGETIIELR